MSELKLLYTLEVANTLGECILWDDRSATLWWTDIHGCKLHNWQPGSARPEVLALPERLCSFGFIEDDERLVCAFASGFALYHPITDELEWLTRPESGYRGTRFNDGRVDRQGRFWAGTMVEGDARNTAGDPVKGSLYCLQGRASQPRLAQVSIANSLCWSRDGRRAYFADSPTGAIDLFDFDVETGALTNRRQFAEVPGPGSPDGSIIDAENCLWNAEWGAGRITRYTPVGQPVYHLSLPVSQPTCVCFAGPGLNWLAVSTARENLDEAQLAREPLAGAVLIFATPFQGLPEARFRLAK